MLIIAPFPIYCRGHNNRSNNVLRMIMMVMMMVNNFVTWYFKLHHVEKPIK